MGPNVFEIGSWLACYIVSMAFWRTAFSQWFSDQEAHQNSHNFPERVSIGGQEMERRPPTWSVHWRQPSYQQVRGTSQEDVPEVGRREEQVFPGVHVEVPPPATFLQSKAEVSDQQFKDVQIAIRRVRANSGHPGPLEFLKIFEIQDINFGFWKKCDNLNVECVSERGNRAE